MIYPTDWTARCEAKCRKTGKQCPHVCTSQIPSTLAGRMVCDKDYFQVHGRPVRLCAGHVRSFYARKERLLTLPLIDGGHLSPWNATGYGSIVIAQDRIYFANGAKATIPAKWGVIGTEGKVPEHLLSLPKYPEEKV